MAATYTREVTEWLMDQWWVCSAPSPQGGSYSQEAFSSSSSPLGTHLATSSILEEGTGSRGDHPGPPERSMGSEMEPNSPGGR